MKDTESRQTVAVISNGKRAMRLLAASAVATMAAAWCSPVSAQQTAEPVPPPAPGAKPVLGPNGQDDSIVITASQVNLTRDYAGGEVARGARAGLLGNLDTMESPFSATSFTAKLIREQQAQSVGDVLKNEPGIEVERGFGNFQQVYMVRGFPVFSDDMTFNGVYGILPREFVASELIERVEIFRGANSFLNGASPGGSAVGGMVNLVPKRAPNDPLFDVTVGAGNIGQTNAALDLAHRYLNGSLGIRFNAAGRWGQTEIRDEHRKLYVGSFGLDYRTSRLRLTADVGYQDQTIRDPRPSVTPTGAAPPPPPARSNFGERWTFAKEKELFGAARGEYDIANSVTAWAAVGGRHGTEENDLANPTLLGTPDGASYEYRFHNYRKDSVISADGGIRAKMTLGDDIENRIIVSGSVFNVSSKNAYDFYFGQLHNNIYTPVQNPISTTLGFPDFNGGTLYSPKVTFTTNTKSVAAADILQAFDHMLTVIAGVRYQHIDNASFDYNSGALQSRVKGHATTPAVGVVVRPIKPLSIFANYSEALVPGQVAPATSNNLPVTNAGQVFQPFKAKQKEAGAKVDFGNIGGSVSVFSIDLPSAFVVNQTFTVAGKQRNKGVEFNVFGEPVKGLRVIGGLTYLNAKTLNSPVAADNGRYALGVPKWQSSLNVEWDIPGTGLTAEGHVTHKGSQYIDGADVNSIPAWTVFDLGARYKLQLQDNHSITLRARVTNVGNKNYWSSAGGYPGANYLVLGEPRSVFVSASFDY